MLRLDQLAFDRGHFRSRQRAADYIREHGVQVDGTLVRKPGRKYPPEVSLALPVPPMPWVSRGALKLLGALETWSIDLEGARVLDIGSSTGGFTEVALSKGATHVVAVDTGTDQLAPELRADARITLREQTDFRSLTPSDTAGCTHFVCDVSFISLRHILPGLPALFPTGGSGVVLVKPQFEAGPEHVGKNGIVRDAAVQARVLEEVLALAKSVGFHIKGQCDSPISGGDGNREFLLWLALRPS